MNYLFQMVILIMKGIYGVLKLMPSKKNKVTFLSRQTNIPSIDYELLKEELLRQDPNLEIVMICKRLEKNPKELLQFTNAILRSLYHMATSRVCILDTYWPPISLLNHKKSLTVIQMWHAMGKIKKSGYQNLKKEGGRDEKTARMLAMHENYDLIIAGGEAWNPFYCESFNVDEKILYNVGLPRVDYIVNNREEIKQRIYHKYPELSNKPVILYAPTWRRTGIKGWDNLIKEIDFEHYNLIVKGHPNQRLTSPSQKVYELNEFSALETLTVCDYLITDYSAIAVEAASIRVKTYYYLYDYEKYSTKNGLNIDLFKEMPGCVFKNAKDLIKSLEKEEYNIEALENYRNKFLPPTIGKSTKLIANKVIESLEDNK